MLHRAFDQVNKILIIEPEGRVTKQDIELLNLLVSPLIDAKDILHWMIHSRHYDHWCSLIKLVESCCRFTGNGEQKIKIAWVSDDPIADMNRLQHPDISISRQFSYDQMDQAKQWLSLMAVE